jgi:hypothetical protein
MNSIIKTISDILPEEYYVTSEQYKTIKNKKINVPSIIFYRYVVKLSYYKYMKRGNSICSLQQIRLNRYYKL